MTERELFKKAIKAHYLDKEKICQAAMRRTSVSNTTFGGTVVMKKYISAFAIVIGVLCLSTITVFAMSRLLSPREAAKTLDQPGVAEAFEKPDAIILDQSATEAGYTVTFLGITSGENLELASSEQSKSYAVVAIANANGSAMREGKSFFVSPLVKGLNPGLHNIVTMNGSYTERIVDGVLYRMIECDSVEMFADRGLYLCVLDAPFYNSDAFVVDQATGSLTPDADYAGLHLLFDLPIDPAKADYQKAEDYLAATFEPKPDDQESPLSASTPDVAVDADGNINANTVMQTAQPIEASRKTLKPDANGNFLYSFSADDARSTSDTIIADVVNAHQPGEAHIASYSSSGDGKTITTWYLVYTRQSDGTLSAVIYQEISETNNG